ncbi:hypothetical protein [Bradyrhizobium prioriisuperbiae]|uniref:hypothetical protein n=1 Tax=Bradyrhizobium prioriisuperbiae TaxID=2854389 RepID=UPI0028F13886|nr:hypothetical protein [Bradyrhizobium prioritasuperba]
MRLRATTARFACRSLMVAIVLLAAGPAPASAEMSRETSISAGSFFAAAAVCEQHDQITKGQVEPMLKQIDQHLSRNNRRWISEGYQRGKTYAAIYVPETKSWTPSTADDTECQRIQAVLDEYKAILTPPAAKEPARK